MIIPNKIEINENKLLHYNNLIAIMGGNVNDIRKALLQWIELYANNLSDNVFFELHQVNKGKYIIKVNGEMNNMTFYYLINYLYYSDKIDHKINIQGFITAQQHILNNKKLLVYIPDKNTAHDDVFVVTEDNETFKINFSGKITPVDDDQVYLLPNLNFCSNPNIIRIDKRGIADKIQEEYTTAIRKKFKIILIAIIGLSTINLFILFKSTELFSKMILFLGIGISVWFFEEYKMLQIKRYYIYCCFIAFIFLIYGITIKHLFHDIELTSFGLLSPASLLIVQKPLRLIFIKIFKREPIVDKPPVFFGDFMYMMLLFSACIILPMIIGSKFK
jgi:hypothetical protein